MTTGKPKVSIDQDGDGVTDVEVDVDVPEDPPPPPVHEWPAGVRDTLTDLVARMEVHVIPPVTRVSYATTRETLRTLLNHNPV